MGESLVFLTHHTGEPGLFEDLLDSLGPCSNLHLISVTKNNTGRLVSIDGTTLREADERGRNAACLKESDRFFLETARERGVPLHNLHIYHHRADLNELTVFTAREIISHYLSEYPESNVIVPSGFAPAGVSADDLILCLAAIDIAGPDSTISLFDSARASVSLEPLPTIAPEHLSSLHDAALRYSKALIRYLDATEELKGAKHESDLAKKRLDKLKKSAPYVYGRKLTAPFRFLKKRL